MMKVSPQWRSRSSVKGHGARPRRCDLPPAALDSRFPAEVRCPSVAAAGGGRCPAPPIRRRNHDPHHQCSSRRPATARRAFAATGGHEVRDRHHRAASRRHGAIMELGQHQAGRAEPLARGSRTPGPKRKSSRTWKATRLRQRTGVIQPNAKPRGGSCSRRGRGAGEPRPQRGGVPPHRRRSRSRSPRSPERGSLLA